MSDELEEIYRRQQPIAFRIAQEAVKLENIPQLPLNYQEPIKRRWEIYYVEKDQDIALTILLSPEVTRATTHISLMIVAWAILREMESLLSSPNAMKTLTVKESEREEEIYNTTLRLTRNYIYHLPLVLFHSFHQALNETLINHIKKTVDYDMRRFLEQTDNPNRKFTLLPNSNLKDITEHFPEVKFELIENLQMINEEFTAYRKASFSDRQVWLTPQAFVELANDYERLRTQYKQAKSKYRVEYQALKAINPRSTFEGDWKKHWEKFLNVNYPEITFTEEILTHSASELAYQQLGERYGISPSYMEKYVGNARKQSENEARKNKTPDNSV